MDTHTGTVRGVTGNVNLSVWQPTYTYRLTEDTLRQIRGVNTTLQQISCGYGILPSTIAKHYRQIRIFRTGAQQNITKKRVL
jgi:hypothetical protein